MDTRLIRERRAPSSPGHEQVAARLTVQEIGEIDRLVQMGFFLNRSDFIRAAAREKLASSEVHSICDVSPAQAEREIVGFLKKHPVAYPSDIAVALELDLTLVMDIVQRLLERKRVQAVSGGHASRGRRRNRR